LTGTQIERVYLSKYRKRYLKGLVKSLIPYKLKVIIRGGANNKTINSAYAVACEKIGGIPDGICYA